MNWLPIIWIGIIGFCIIMYVILDGFTLGTGILTLFLSEKQRDVAASVILPTWDGNQTWLVLGMASLYGAFPIAFSILLPKLYLPLLIMVIALLLRGVAFEFRMKAKKKKRWDHVLSTAAIVVTLVQGFIVGDFVQGFQGSIISAFSAMTAVSLVFGYCLLGSTRLVLKTEGKIQMKMHRFALICSIGLMVAIFIASVWTPYIYPLVKQRWFNLEYMTWLAILPLITIMAFVALLWSIYHKYERWPFWLAVILFLCPYAGFVISIFPYIVPYRINLWQAASPNGSLEFILVGAVIMIPVLLFYTGYAYRIFRGKVNDSLHY